MALLLLLCTVQSLWSNVSPYAVNPLGWHLPIQHLLANQKNCWLDLDRYGSRLVRTFFLPDPDKMDLILIRHCDNKL